MRRLWPIALVVLAGVALSFALTERYHHRVLTLVLVWATMGLAWNIISGYAGQTSFKVWFERLRGRPDRVYGVGLGSSYQHQTLSLSKHFRR